MKYNDRNTRKHLEKWQGRHQDNDLNRFKIKEENRLKKMICEFSYIISDKLWWNSLTKEDQKNAFNDYHNYNTWWSGNPVYNYYAPIDISNDEHLERIEYLKQKYNRPDRRRDLVIDDILKFDNEN